MRRLAFVPFLLVAALAIGQLSGQEKDAPGKARGQLPQNWAKLGLTDEQKQKVYELQSALRAKTDALKKQIKELEEQEKKDLEKVLTDAQKARLKEIINSKTPGATTTTPEKK